jgi:hypothetical protein
LASFAYLDPALEVPGAQVVGISDPDPGLVASLSEKLGCVGNTDFRALYRETTPDFVFALGRHSDMVEEAHFRIEEGIPFALEKPCRLNALDVAALAALGARRGSFSSVPLVRLPGRRWSSLKSCAATRNSPPAQDAHRGLHCARRRSRKNRSRSELAPGCPRSETPDQV